MENTSLVVAQNDLARNPAILHKYKQASALANAAARFVVSQCQPGERISRIRLDADRFVLQEARKADPAAGMLDCGLAIPTVVCRNNMVCNWAPLPDASTSPDSDTIQLGDLLKVEVGCHVDGYICIAGCTLVAGHCGPASGQMPITGRMADVLVAAHCIERAIEALLAPGTDCIPSIYKAVNRICRMYSCCPVAGIDSVQVKRFVLDGETTIPAVLDAAFPRTKQHTVSAGDVFCINVCISTGTGQLTRAAETNTIYNRDVSRKPSVLKLDASRQLIGEIDAAFGVFPFCTGMLQDGKALKFGLKECIDAGLLRLSPPLQERTEEFVAQVRFTVAVGEAGNNVRLSERFEPPYARSSFVFQDDELAQLMTNKARHL